MIFLALGRLFSFYQCLDFLTKATQTLGQVGIAKGFFLSWLAFLRPSPSFSFCN